MDWQTLAVIWFLIEGVLLSNWLLLEFDKGATPEIKARYGITALSMYIALLVIGWRHEGPTGLALNPHEKFWGAWAVSLRFPYDLQVY